MRHEALLILYLNYANEKHCFEFENCFSQEMKKNLKKNHTPCFKSCYSISFSILLFQEVPFRTLFKVFYYKYENVSTKDYHLSYFTPINRLLNC